MYIRPQITAPSFVDDAGVPPPYGDRWSFDDGPPPESYSRESNLGRFAPLHTIANALIDHLVRTYDVTVTDLGPESDYLNATVRHVAIGPVVGERIVVLLTDYPSAGARFGPDHEVHYPRCSCDACDETWEYGAEMLEFEILRVAAHWPRR